MALGETKSMREGFKHRAKLKRERREELRKKAKKLKSEGLEHSVLLHRLGVSATQLYKLLKG